MALQKSFRGLQRFLGFFSGGNVKFELGADLVPTLDMDNWLSPNVWTFSKATVAQNGFIEITVPEDEFWRLKWASARVNPPAGVNVDLDINIQRAIGGVNENFLLRPAKKGLATEFDATNGDVGGYSINVTGLDANPGDKIVASLQRESGPGNNQLSLYVLYQQIFI